MNTAVGLLLSAIGLWLVDNDNPSASRKMAGQVFAAGVAGLGVLTLSQDLFGIDFGIDEALIRDDTTDERDNHPGRMAPTTAFNFIMAGIALLLLRSTAAGRAGSSQVPAVVIFVVAFAALLGHVYDAVELESIAPFTRMALHTSIAFVVLAVGILCAKPRLGLMSVITSAYQGGVLARRILPVVLIVVPALGWIRLVGQRAELFSTETGLVLYTLFNVVVLTPVILLTAAVINRRHAMQEQIDAELRESEARFRSLAENMPGVIYQRVLDRGGTLRYPYVSAGVEKMCGEGVDPERIMADGTAFLNSIHPDDRGRFMNEVRRSAATGSRLELECRIVTTTGETKWVQSFSQPRSLEDGSVIWDCLLIDVTGRKNAEAKHTVLEEQLRQSQKMEAVGQLTGGLAHDFNNLLTVILGNAVTLAEELTDVRQCQMAELINAAGVRAADLTRRLLVFSRRQVLQPSMIEASELIKEMEPLLRHTLGANIAIAAKLQPGLWPINADRAQLENALLNLAINARDAMPNGGAMTIETANVSADEGYAALNPGIAPGEYVMLALTDIGSGIAADMLEKVFEPFFTTKPAGKGSGLGLSMVYGFVRQSGGLAKIYSEVGNGTTVRLYFPRHVGLQREETRDAAPESPLPMGRETILLVEDDDLVRQSTKTTLEGLGYKVIEAADAKRARQHLESSAAIDLLLTDVMMPGGRSGDQLAEEARRLRPNLAVLFMSGYPGAAIVARPEGFDGEAFIGKPYTRREMAEKVRAALDRRGAAPQRILIIDDEELLRRTVQRTLADAGYDVVDAADGEAGLEQLKHGTFDIAVVDIFMPGKEGIETIMQLRRSRPAMKIIAISGGGAPGEWNLLGVAQRLGADRALAKPFTSDQLLAVVKEVLAKRSAA
ncbi:MAG: response regulator [Proteobacteria bacterium]|nr:response regulator [Pseudomonadota bacterium]